MSNQRPLRRRIRRGVPLAALGAAAAPALIAGGLTVGAAPSSSDNESNHPVVDDCVVSLLGGGAAQARLDARSAALVLDEPDEVVVTSRSCVGDVAEVLLRVDGVRRVGAVVPPAGEGVSAHVTPAEGSDGAELHVRTLSNAAVVASGEEFPADLDDKLSALFPDLGWGERPPVSPLPGDLEHAEVPEDDPDVGVMNTSTKCTRNDGNWNNRRESDNHTWRINHSSYPAYLDSTQATRDIRDGPDGWSRFPRTDCLSVPLNSIRQTYAGTTSLMPNISAARSCQSRDGTNVWGFRSLTGTSVLAVACSYWVSFPFLTDEITEGDVAFNTNVTWGHTVDQCTPESRKYMIGAVATHEAGHVFGFGHVDQSSDQVMVPATTTCSKAMYNLGRGDMRVAHEVYSP